MIPPRRTAAVVLAASVVAWASGCTITPVGESPSASAPTDVVPTPSATPDASASATPAGLLDLTRPGAARALVDDLLKEAGATRTIMVTITATDAAVTVLHDGVPQMWAWRDGRIQQVPTDITHVDQRTFDPDDYALDDVGALFRAARSVAGSDQGQALQIVDYSHGLVTLSVSTVPESRTVFFRPDGTLLPTLDFTSAWGLRRGFEDAVADRTSASAIGFGSAEGVYLDTAQDGDGRVERHARKARTPVLVTDRTTTSSLDPFPPDRVDPDAVWGVLGALHRAGEFPLDTPWSCVVDDRAGIGVPRMYFTVGDQTFTTNLDGRVID